MGGSVMFSCRTALPLDVKSLKKVSLKYKAESEASEIVVPKTMEHSAYVPRVENISPALPTDDVKDETIFQVSKDDLLQQITNIDQKITQTESEIKTLGKKLLELKKTAELSTVGNEGEEVKTPQSHTLAITIYAENKRKHQESDSFWEKLGPKVIMPLYNQPSDTIIYHENRKKHLVFKYCLLKFLKCRQAENSLQENYLIDWYMEKKQEWLNKVKAVESSLAHKKKEAEKKIIFEREFPKLRKQIEEKRKQRLSQIESHFGVNDKGQSACAIICPMLLPSRQQEFSYVNNNGLIQDLPSEYKEQQLINVWTDAEKAIFKEKYLQHPKQFGIIASYLDQKNIRDCIKYYYQSKQTENYKSLLRKTRKRAHMGCNGLPAKRANIAQFNTGKVLGTPTGSVTCLQPEKEARQVLYNVAVGSGDVEQTVQSSLVAHVTQPLVDSLSTKLSAPLVPSPALMSDAVTVNTDPPEATHVPAVDLGNAKLLNYKDEKIESSENTFEGAGFQSDELVIGRAEYEEKMPKVESKEEVMEITTDIEYKSSKTDVHNGIVRSIMLDHSKHLPHSDVSQYSVCEEQALHGTQVPSTCSCKFRGGCYTHCQVLTYQNSQNQIQHSSTKWNDSHQKLGVSKEDDGVAQPNVSNESSDVKTVNESYNATVLKNPVSTFPVVIKNESTVPEATSQTEIHNFEKPLYGNPSCSVVMQSPEESYRSLVIKTTNRCEEVPNRSGNNFHHQPLKLGNGIVKPLTSSVTTDVPVGENAMSKQVHSVKDLVMEVIEKQIMKNFGRYDASNVSGEGKGALAPTLSSILQTHHLVERNQTNFTSGFQDGEENRNLILSQESSLQTSRQPSHQPSRQPTSHQPSYQPTMPTLPLSQKQHVPPMTTYQVITTSSCSSQEYFPEVKETNFLSSGNFQSRVDVGKHCFPTTSVIASHHRSQPLLPTPILHQKHYPITSVHQVAVHNTHHSSPIYLPRGSVPVNQVRHHQVPIQDNEGTLDLSTKKFREHNSSGLFSEEFTQRRPFQNPSVQLPSQLSHYLSQTAMQTVQRKVRPQELLAPVSSSSVSAHRNRYPSVISQSVTTRDQVYNFSGGQSHLLDDHRLANSNSGSTSNVDVRTSSQVEVMADIYKPYFP